VNPLSPDGIKFFELMRALLLARETAGGELSQDEESRRVGEMDLCWRKMSEEEQLLADAEFSTEPEVAA
jgi:hypothetical protein